MEPNGIFMVIDADDIDDAEYRMTEIVKDKSPDATMIVIDLKEIK